MNPAVSFFLACVYIMLYISGVFGLLVWKRRRRKVRLPLEFKLLRGPGESLRKRIAAFEEDLLLRVLGAAGVPLFVLYLAFLSVVSLRSWEGFNLNVGLVCAAVAFAAALYFSSRWLMRGIARVSNDRLGYLGEREVAEHLSLLGAKGYRVFHDVPAENGGKRFNLDHVAVGPGGVAVVEVKTRRKGRARPGYKDHVVTFDGRQLIWPWGEDQHGIAQCLFEASWFQKWIEQRTGIKTTVKPILAIPGWWVESKAPGQVVVVNSKSVASAVEGRGAPVLTSDQVDLISRQLEVVCRDVED